MNKLYLIVFVLLFGCSANQEVSIAGSPVQSYERSNWGRWVDNDGDCQDTRQEVLIAESKIPVTFKTERNCKVKSGLWIDSYSGISITDPSEIDIDHTVSLKEAFDAGGYMWNDSKKKNYFNDLSYENHLIAVGRSTNRSKGSRGPDRWLPRDEYACTYLMSRVTVMKRWGLDITCEESQLTLKLISKHCK